ncbi:MAG: hypothetical protein HY962_06075 [Ignavibacteriae bacterium]|nr:hypothetical protein [Ignavibacteriota bacterium]
MKRVIPEYKTLAEVLQDAIDKEKDAEVFYREAAAMAQATDIREFLTQMADMERDHFDMLTRRLDALRADQQVMDGILSSYGEEEEPAA